MKLTLKIPGKLLGPSIYHNCTKNWNRQEANSKDLLLKHRQTKLKILVTAFTVLRRQYQQA